MSLSLEIPGWKSFALDHLVLDVNGTLTDRGELIEGVAERLSRVTAALDVHLLSADTFGTLDEVAARLGALGTRVASGDDKRRVLSDLGAEHCVAVGNGANDEAMFEAAALAVAVVGPEGAAGAALRAADVVCSSILDALDLLLDERVLAATLRR
jgi:soluble P-type ATPase